MNILGFLSLVLSSCLHVYTSDDWSWVGGDNSAGAWSTSSQPGARSGSSVWKDSDGLVWLFGGMGFSDLGKGSAELLNDLWTYNMSVGVWKLIHPGTVTTLSSDDHAPSPRQLASACGVKGITLVVYGGLGDKDEGLDDTWVYYMNKHRWMALSEVDNYTSRVQNLSLEVPFARGDVAAWCLSDSMYIFGGLDNTQIFDDMWKFSLKHLEWSEVVFPPVSNKSNIYPFGRNGATTWVSSVDGDITLFMFGGNKMENNFRNKHMNVGYTTDMWRFSVKVNKWKYLRGKKDGCENTRYGDKADPSGGGHPGCRRRATGWTDTNQNLWMYGGDGTDEEHASVFHSTKLLSDLWMYNIKENTWVFYGGGKAHHDDDSETPGGRYEAMHWSGSQDQFFLMGGLGHDRHEFDGYLNDIWMVDVEYIVNQRGVAGSLIVLYLLLVVTIVLVMAGLYLYARDRNGFSVWSRFDQNVKYSQLTTVAD